MKATYLKRLQESGEVLNKLFSLEKKIIALTEKIVSTFACGGKLIFMGNGGSASDSMHIAAEYINKFFKMRKSLPAHSLSSDVSVITSIANDFEYKYIFRRQLESMAGKHDVVVALSTSGESANIIHALEFCKASKIFSVSFTRGKENSVSKLSDLPINIPSEDTPRIQEAYLLINHIVCELVDMALEKK